MLTNSDQRIEACARQVSSKMSSKRSLQTGQHYSLPPVQEGAVPSASELPQEWREHVLGSITATRQGLSLASAMCQSYRVSRMSKRFSDS